MKAIKTNTFALFVYYLYNYILIVAFAYTVKAFLEIHYPEFQFQEDAAIFSFHGKYFVMVLSYLVTVFVSSALTFWVLEKPSKKTMFWISFPYALGSLAYGVLAIYMVFFTELQNKEYFYDGFIFAALAFIIPLISIVWPLHKKDLVSAFFYFRKRHLLWIWIPILFYLPAILNFAFVNIVISIINFFQIIPSFNIIEGLKEAVYLVSLALLFKLYYKPLEYTLNILNKALLWNLSNLKRGLLIVLILIAGYFIAFGAHYLISLIPF